MNLPVPPNIRMTEEALTLSLTMPLSSSAAAVAASVSVSSVSVSTVSMLRSCCCRLAGAGDSVARAWLTNCPGCPAPASLVWVSASLASSAMLVLAAIFFITGFTASFTVFPASLAASLLGSTFLAPVDLFCALLCCVPAPAPAPALLCSWGVELCLVTVLLAAPAPGVDEVEAAVVAEAASAFRSSTSLAGLGLGGTAGGWRGVRLRKVTDSGSLGELGTGVLSLPALAAEVLALLAVAAEVLSLVLVAPEVLVSGVLSLSLAAVEAFSFLASAGALPAAVADCCLLSEAVLLTSPLAAARLLPDSEAVLSSPGRGLAFAPPASSALLTWSSSVTLAGSH